MKKILTFLCVVLFSLGAYAAQVVNVEYIHNAIKQKWDITVPYNPALENPRVVANMKYLLTTIDVANEMLNGDKTTDYGNGEYATQVAADTIATDMAVDGLVKKNDRDVLIMVVGNPDYTGRSCHTIMFDIAAAGKFVVDWGDGTSQTIEHNNTDTITYEHTYSEDVDHTVRISGRATAYDNSDTTFSLYNPTSVMVQSVLKLDGCLGCIFPTLTDGSQPKFTGAFSFQGGLSGELPAGFFAGIHGQLRPFMFANMFSSTGLTSVGAPLFDDLSGDLSEGAFSSMFRWCPELTGESAKMQLSDGSIKYLYEVYPDATYAQVGACYWQSMGLTDYANMPYNWTYWDI